jgi:hypothetical protein
VICLPACLSVCLSARLRDSVVGWAKAAEA